MFLKSLVNWGAASGQSLSILTANVLDFHCSHISLCKVKLGHQTNKCNQTRKCNKVGAFISALSLWDERPKLAKVRYVNQVSEIFRPDNQERSDAGFNGFFSKMLLSSFKRCGNSESESAVINATGTSA